MSALPALFLFVDGVAKLVKPAPVVEGTLQLGYPESVILGLGIILLTCTILYVIPRTAILGAILLTGYLGGAIATHVRVGNPLFSHTSVPGLYRRADLGRTLLARRTVARPHSAAELAALIRRVKQNKLKRQIGRSLYTKITPFLWFDGKAQEAMNQRRTRASVEDTNNHGSVSLFHT